MNGEHIEISVPEEGELERIDRFLTRSLEMDLSRSLIQRLIREERIVVNGAVVKPNHRLHTDDIVAISFPEPETLDLEPQNIPLDILYQDGDLAVINKPAGLVVHPGPGNSDGTLVNAQMGLRKAMQSIIEQNASMAGLPGRTELDSAHRKIAELERLVRRMQRKGDADDEAASPPPVRKAAAKPAPAPKPAAQKATARKPIAKKLAKPDAKKSARSVKAPAKPVAANRRTR